MNKRSYKRLTGVEVSSEMPLTEFKDLISKTIRETELKRNIVREKYSDEFI